jgi:hypothetical protein
MFLVLVCTASLCAQLLPSGADTVGPIDLEPPTYALGTVRGQDSPPWTGADCGGTIDQAVVSTAGFAGAPASFGTQSLRISNAVVAGCFIDLFTPQTTDEAGETGALNGGLSGGTRQPFFAAEFVLASTTGALQPGLEVQVSPDRGDGARMSFLRMRHTATTLEFEFFDVQGITGVQPCTGCANFVSTVFSGYDATVPHTVRIEMELIDGPSNDIVRILIDGVLVHTGRSWEDYYTMDDESAGVPPVYASRTVDSLLIRASGAAAPTLSGQGFLIDGFTEVRTGSVPGATPGSQVGGISAVVADPRFTG